MPVGTTLRRPPRPVLTTGLLLLSTVAGALALGVATALPASAADDPSRPDALVTHGPSCRTGGVVVEVTAGTVAYAVTLTTTRHPEGEDSAEVQPGVTVVLRTGDVEWGETIDTRLEYTALDGSGLTHVDELDGHDYTRPSEADCAAITAPQPPQDVSPAPSSEPGSETGAAPGSGPGSAPPAPEVQPLPGAPAPSPGPGAPADGPVAGGPAAGAVSASARQVPAGGRVVLTGTGFTPGEPVTVRVADGEVLTTVAAGPDGTVEVTVRIPGGVSAGPATVQLAGADSAVTAAVQLQVAAVATPVAPEPLPVPLVAAGLALVVGAAGLVLTAARPRPDAAPAWPTGSA
ncbi:hypothetical protein SAMN05660690_1270 [Geodermatophilus telluris]|uniref:IPT/TIG domain-containing protein n=1 Tax=Geodermatophilus telluris TaxID=1190417 RepID=A0A1G6L966_9ACTN|nr:hypothetical protein [Geodermatophilus telluris]SDC39820.1 hypothetical protein SAMN05660690_1270 [Geodermatophilus telluris]